MVERFIASEDLNDRVAMAAWSELKEQSGVCLWPGAAVPDVRRKQTMEELCRSAKGCYPAPAPTGSRRPILLKNSKTHPTHFLANLDSKRQFPL